MVHPRHGSAFHFRLHVRADRLQFRTVLSPRRRSRFRWDGAVYEPGELRVVVYKQGKRWATQTQRTTGEAFELRLSPDRAKLRADGRDLEFVTASVTDNQGQVVPRANPAIRFAAKGPADIVGVDNGDPTSLVSFQALERRAFNGLCLVIVRTRARKPGAIVVSAHAENLKPGRVSLKSGS
jgi:beta-galactosidase